MRRVLGVVFLMLLASCVTFSPMVKRAPTVALSGFDLVYFTFGDSWATHHSMTEVLQQEFERRRFVVLLQEPAPELWERTLRLRLDLVEDARAAGKERPDQVGRLGFRLEKMVDGTEVGRVSYEGMGLDRIGQRDLAEEIVTTLLKGAEVNSPVPGTPSPGAS